MPYKAVLTFLSPGDAIVLFIILYKVVQTLTSVDETQVYDHSNERY